VLLGQPERLAPLGDAGVARVAQLAQRVDGRRVGRCVWAEGREHMRPYRTA